MDLFEVREAVLKSLPVAIKWAVLLNVCFAGCVVGGIMAVNVWRVTIEGRNLIAHPSLAPRHADGVECAYRWSERKDDWKQAECWWYEF